MSLMHRLCAEVYDPTVALRLVILWGWVFLMCEVPLLCAEVHQKALGHEDACVFRIPRKSTPPHKIVNLLF